MSGLVELADEFDKMHAEAQKVVDDRLLKEPGRWMGETFGPDSWLTYGVAIFPAIQWAIVTFTMGAGKGLVDTLRMGEGWREGTASGWFHDGLRLLNVLPVVGMAGKGIGGLSRMIATSAAGGEYAMSCGATSTLVASRLSGARALISLEKYGAMFGKTVNGTPASVKSPDFPGIYFEDMQPVLRQVGARAQTVDVTNASLQQIEQAASQSNGPMVFGVQWWSGSGGVSPARAAQYGVNYADHWLVAFRNTSGRVMVADQFGIRPIAQAGTIGGTSSQFSITAKALAFENISFARGVETATKAGMTLTGTSSAASANWLAASMGVEMVVVNLPTALGLDAATRQALGRPPRGMPGVDPSGGGGSRPDNGGGGANGQTPIGPMTDEIPAPNPIPTPNIASSTLVADTLLVQSRLPRAGTVELSQLVVDTGLSWERVRNALLSLARTGMIRVHKWVAVAGKETPALVSRAF